MEIFIKACGAILLTVVVTITLGSRGKDYSVVLGIFVCCVGTMAALEYVRPVIDFLEQLENIGGLDHNMVRILLKAAGVGLVTEIAALVCNDSGNGSLGKTVKLLGSAAVLWLSLPMYTVLIELLQEILGGL